MHTIAVYGGAFNPPHVGHAMVASWIKLTGQADEVWFVPSASHPFGKEMTSFEQRLEWCKAMARELGPWAIVTAAESALPQPNYTINLLRYLQENLPDDRIRFVMGVDNLLKRDKWFGFNDIEREFAPIFVDRGGIEHNLTLASPKFPDVSSSEVRRLLAEGKPVSHLVPACVVDQMRGYFPEKQALQNPGNVTDSNGK